MTSTSPGSPQAVSFKGTLTLGGQPYTASLTGTLTPVTSTGTGTGTTTTPPPAGAVPFPFPAALASHALLEQYLPEDLYAWRFAPGTTTPVTNSSGVAADPSSPRNVTVAVDGGLSVLKLATTSAADCGVIQSPGKYPTASGVVETLIKFSGFTGTAGRFFADWASFWMYGDNWPQGGEIDAVETQYGNSYVSYHYGTVNTEATTDPWTYAAKKGQLAPKNTAAVPAKPNILPDTWTHVTLAFGPGKVDVYYEGVLYCTISGSYVTGAPMYITAGTSFGAGGLGANQAPYDQPGSVELQWVRWFS